MSHFFIHNAYFKSNILNNLFSLLESLTIGFSQAFYHVVHMRHHRGNMDRQDSNGKTIDWLSIYRFGHHNHVENVFTYVSLGYFRDDPIRTYKEMYRHSKFTAYWGLFEIFCWLTMWGIMAYFNWRFFLFFIPFYYFGHCLSFLNGYYLHYGSNPDVPIAWAVSSYKKFYNWLWFNNGYHGEHHYRPRVHWSKMEELHQEIAQEQVKAGTRVIHHAHALGFIDAITDPPGDKITSNER